MNSELDEDFEHPDNYKRDNKNEIDEDENEEIKDQNPGFCGGWCGLKFVLNKVGSIVIEDPAEAFTAGNLNLHNYKKQRRWLSLQEIISKGRIS